MLCFNTVWVVQVHALNFFLLMRSDAYWPVREEARGVNLSGSIVLANDVGCQTGWVKGGKWICVGGWPRRLVQMLGMFYFVFM